MDNNEYQEDVACLVEPVLDVDESIYWEVDVEYYFKESV